MANVRIHYERATCLRLAVLTAVGTCVVAPAASAAASAKDIIRRQGDSMKGVKTYLATWKTTSSVGMTSTTTIASEMTTGRFRMTTSMSGMGAPSGKKGQTIIVDDGRNMYNYAGYTNSWSKSPHDPKTAKMFSDPSSVQAEAERNMGITYSLLPSTKIGGRTVYAVQVHMKGFAGMGGKSKVVHYIDQRTYRTVLISTSMTMPIGRGKMTTVTSKTMVVSEKINPAIPAGTFRFTPPPGSKQASTPSFGNMMPRRRQGKAR